MNGSGALTFYRRLILEFENHGASSCVRRTYLCIKNEWCLQ